MNVYVDKELGEHFSSALFKMKSVLRSSQKKEVSHISPSVLMRYDKNVFNKKSLLHYQHYSKAFQQNTKSFLNIKIIVKIQYLNALLNQ